MLPWCVLVSPLALPCCPILLGICSLCTDAGDPVMAHRHYPHSWGGFRAEPEDLGIPVQSLSLLCSSLEPDMAEKDFLSQLAVVEPGAKLPGPVVQLPLGAVRGCGHLPAHCPCLTLPE